MGSVAAWAARFQTLPSSHKTSAENVERAVLIGVDLDNDQGIGSEGSLAELGALAESAGAQVAGTVSQKLKGIDPRTFIGRGKVAEVREIASARGAALAIFDDSLSPAQVPARQVDVVRFADVSPRDEGDNTEVGWVRFSLSG